MSGRTHNNPRLPVTEAELLPLLLAGTLNCLKGHGQHNLVAFCFLWGFLWFWFGFLHFP